MGDFCSFQIASLEIRVLRENFLLRWAILAHLRAICGAQKSVQEKMAAARSSRQTQQKIPIYSVFKMKEMKFLHIIRS